MFRFGLHRPLLTEDRWHFSPAPTNVNGAALALASPADESTLRALPDAEARRALCQIPPHDTAMFCRVWRGFQSTKVIARLFIGAHTACETIRAGLAAEVMLNS